MKPGLRTIALNILGGMFCHLFVYLPLSIHPWETTFVLNLCVYMIFASLFLWGIQFNLSSGILTDSCICLLQS